MRLTTLFVLLFLLPGKFIKAQTTITGTVTDTLHKPISSASVYLSKTTYGVFTDEKGKYMLTVDQDGVYEMIVSCVGYKPWSQFISTEAKKQNIDIKLSVNLIVLKEVSISSKNKNRLADYSLFIKLFLGETVNSEYCKITNPEDLHLYRDDQNKILNGFSFKPLRIENRALGYLIIYDLSDFSYNRESGLLRFRGNHFFQTMSGSKKEINRWSRDRLSAYYGSIMHFFRAVYGDSLQKENFNIFEYKVDSATKEFSINKQLTGKDLMLLRKNNFMSLYFKDPVLISYKDNHPELATGLTGFTARQITGTVSFSDIINVYRNGYFDNPYSITWGGEMANDRIADMLPYDFLVTSQEKNGTGFDPTSSSIDKYLLAQQAKKSRDQIFVQTDRNLYYPGDTIYFQAYIRDRFTYQFETKSVLLYAMLFDNNRKVADSSGFKITKSTSSGWMTVPEKAGTGKFHFVAFTAMMQNYDPKDAFNLDLYVRERIITPENIEVEFNKSMYGPGDTIEANIFISDLKKEPSGQQKFQFSLLAGNKYIKTIESQTNRNGKSTLSFVIPDTVVNQLTAELVTKRTYNRQSTVKEFKIPFDNQFLEFRFLPEGGTLVEGLPQRVGFNATDFKGEPVSVSGLLKSASGSVIDTLRSGPYGPGLFTCTPQPGMYAELPSRNGKPDIWLLPEPLKKGVCLSVRPVDNNSLAIEIQSTDYTGDTMTVTGIMNHVLILSQKISLDKKQRIIVQTGQLPSGVSQITLFNNELRPIAERIIYVNPDKHLRFDIKSSRDLYHPGEETELTVNVTDNSGKPVEGIFTIAVADSLTGHNEEIFVPGIEYTYNLEENVSMSMPAGVLTGGPENLSDESRDLLFMVYGWTKYNWDFAPQKETVPVTDNYEILKMKILYTLKMHRSDRRLDLISLEGPSIKHFLTNTTGEISLPLDSLPDITRSVTMMPDPKNKKRVTGAMLSIPFNEKFFRSNKLITPTHYIPDIHVIPSVKTAYKSSFIIADSMIQIPQVIIQGHPGTKKVYHDKYEEMYQYANIRSLEPQLLWKSYFMEDAIRKLYNPYSMTQKNIILRSPRSMFGGGMPALFVIDGQKIYGSEGWQYAKTISPGEMTSLTMLLDDSGTTIYGMEAAGGIIFINTHTDDPNLMKLRTIWRLQNKKDKMLLPISIYRAEKEFYQPTKFDTEYNPVVQSRSTIFWKSEVYFNGKEPVKIKYNNLKHNGPVIITINGVSYNNLVGTGRADYIVN